MFFLASILFPMAFVVALLVYVWSQGWGLALLAAGVLILPVGLAAQLLERKVNNRDRDIADFLRSLGAVTAARGSTVVDSLGHIDRRVIGSLEPELKQLFIYPVRQRRRPLPGAIHGQQHFCGYLVSDGGLREVLAMKLLALRRPPQGENAVETEGAVNASREIGGEHPGDASPHPASPGPLPQPAGVGPGAYPYLYPLAAAAVAATVALAAGLGVAFVPRSLGYVTVVDIAANPLTWTALGLAVSVTALGLLGRWGRDGRRRTPGKRPEPIYEQQNGEEEEAASVHLGADEPVEIEAVAAASLRDEGATHVGADAPPEEPLDSRLLDIFRDAKNEVQEGTLASELADTPIHELVWEVVALHYRLRLSPGSAARGRRG